MMDDTKVAHRSGDSGVATEPVNGPLQPARPLTMGQRFMLWLTASEKSGAHHTSFWVFVACLTGVDYFSTLGYQPSIAFEAMGLLAPMGTVLVVLMTLFGALPVYSRVAAESPNGQGSIAMLERLLRGWTAKIFVLFLLGFVATDFVITKTLSAADAATHIIKNPAIWPEMTETMPFGVQRMIVTCVLLLLLGGVFLVGFREAIGIAVVLVVTYLTLNTIIIVSGIVFLINNPQLLYDWWTHAMAGPEHWHIHGMEGVTGGLGSVTLVLLMLRVCFQLYPKLALGLSGFETGVAVMTLIRGDKGDTEQNPTGRIRNTRRLLLTVALIMSMLLLGSSMVVATLIGPEAFAKDADPTANERALAYLAHGQSGHQLNPWFGPVFGTIYDIDTAAILWFAGASAMAGMLTLFPRYLRRFGMAPEIAALTRPLVILLTIVNLIVTWVFDADVTAQGGAYATGVLVLMTSAGIAVSIDAFRKAAGPLWRRIPWGYGLITAVFIYTTVMNMVERPDGIKIATWFIVAILITSFASRIWRSMELRFEGFAFRKGDTESEFLWNSIKGMEFPVLVPHRPGRRNLFEKEAAIRAEHRLAKSIPIIFVEVVRGDTSDFVHKPVMEVARENGHYILKMTGAASISHTIAAIAIELAKHGRPPEIHFGWSDESPLSVSFGFFLFGEGNVPWMVRELLRKAEPLEERRPTVIVG